MDDKACDLLNEVDEYFNNRGVNVVKFNKFTKYHSYCPYEKISKKNKCLNDYERINALGSYLFKEIMKIDKAYKWPDGDKRHIEVFMIWLGDKLFKIENDYKVTLEESYKNNLEPIVGNVKYWEGIDSKKLYKKATIKKMSDFYNLLNYICKLIIEYNKNPDSKRLGNYSAQCISYYRAIHRSANECGPYLQLLDSLKMIYENYRMYKMYNNYNIKENDKKLLLNRVKHLTTFQNENRYLLPVNAVLDFDYVKCVDVRKNDEKIGEQIASQKPKNPARGAQTRVSGNAQRGNTGYTKLPAKPAHVKPPASKPAAPPPPKKAELPPAKPTSAQTSGGKSSQKPRTPPKSETDHQSGTKDSGSNKENKDGGVSQPGSSKGKSKDDPQKKTGQVGTPSSGPKAGSQPTGVKNQGSGTDDQGKSSDKTGGGADGQGDSGNQTQLSGNPPHGNPVIAPSGAGTIPPSVQPPEKPPTAPQPKPEAKPGAKDQTSQQNQTQPVAPVGPPAATPPSPSVQLPDPSQTNSQQTGQQQTDPLPADPSAPPSQDGSSIQTPQAGGSTSQNEPKDPGSNKGSIGGASGNKGDPNGGNGNSGGGVNGGGSGQGDQGNPSGGSSDPASSTSGGSFNFLSPFLGFIFNGTNKFNQASKFVKENHQKFKDAKDKISDAYNNTVDNLKIVYNASSDYFNSVVSNITSQLNQVDAPSKTGSSGNNSPQNSDPSQKNGNIPPFPPSSPQPNSLPTPPTNPPPKPSIDPQQIMPPVSPSNPMSNPTQDPPKVPLQQSQSPPQSKPTQINSSSQQTVGQFVKSLSSDLILKKPWNIFPTTWNGSGDCKPEIKFMNTTLVCCTSEQCSLTGITVTLVLIPIILLIAYKYLSLGSSKKSEKKNMKRVIKLVDGNRKTKIIISSSDRNKDLKPVINLVGKKKDPLLNIYKIIQVDPMPFINLFFLLIFFVYKRKRDTIE
ncbi:PIR protein CIR protein [Plasmodium vinckei lentum]|uniref:PIR protein CIR protein n=1 Tax=Plasmodium vinckei lentum TaxID=138297 RepID=A0A6V7RU57_PLAVN|nr:PIR protein CIR protein [Plasmodium vinckei lentum]